MAFVYRAIKPDLRPNKQIENEVELEILMEPSQRPKIGFTIPRFKKNHKFNKVAKNPSPNPTTYNIKSSFQKSIKRGKNIAFMTLTKKQQVQKNLVPGPGHYSLTQFSRKPPFAKSIHKSLIKNKAHTPSIPMGVGFSGYFYQKESDNLLPLNQSKGHKGTHENSVGPGQYQQKSTFQSYKKIQNQSFYFLSGTMRRFGNCITSPIGPGTYDPPSLFKKRRHFQSKPNPLKDNRLLPMNYRQSDTKKEEADQEYLQGSTPGPGSYKYLIRKSNTAFTIPKSRVQGSKLLDEQILEPKDILKQQKVKQSRFPFGSSEARFYVHGHQSNPFELAQKAKSIQEKVLYNMRKGYIGNFLFREARFKTPQPPSFPGPGTYQQFRNKVQRNKEGFLSASQRFEMGGVRDLKSEQTELKNYNIYHGFKAQLQQRKKGHIEAFPQIYQEADRQRIGDSTLFYNYFQDKPQSKPLPLKIPASPPQLLQFQLRPDWVDKSFNVLFNSL